MESRPKKVWLAEEKLGRRVQMETTYLVYYLMWDNDKKKVAMKEFKTSNDAEEFTKKIDGVYMIREVKEAR